jgi:hypothetical protein
MKTIGFCFVQENADASLESFRNLLKCMQNPHFDSAYIKYSDTRSEDNPEFPLILKSNSANQEIKVSGVTIGPTFCYCTSGQRELLSASTLKILSLAGFKVNQSIQNMILGERELHVTIWND